MIFFSFVNFFVPNGYLIEISKWAFILMDFMGFSFGILKVILPYLLITTFSNMGFDLVLKGFIKD